MSARNKYLKKTIVMDFHFPSLILITWGCATSSINQHVHSSIDNVEAEPWLVNQDWYISAIQNQIIKEHHQSKGDIKSSSTHKNGWSWHSAWHPTQSTVGLVLIKESSRVVMQLKVQFIAFIFLYCLIILLKFIMATIQLFSRNKSKVWSKLQKGNTVMGATLFQKKK